MLEGMRMTKPMKSGVPVGSVVVDGTKSYRIISQVSGQLVCRPENADALDHQDFMVPVEELNKKLNNSDFELKSPKELMRGSTMLTGDGAITLLLDKNKRDRMLFVHVCCMAIETVGEKKGEKITEPWIYKNYDLIQEEIRTLHRQVLGKETVLGNKRLPDFQAPNACDLMKQYKFYKSDHYRPEEFRDKRDQAGRPPTLFDQWVIDLMSDAAKITLEGRVRTVTRALETLDEKLSKENAIRLARDPGFQPVTVSRRKFDEFIRSLGVVAAGFTRLGRSAVTKSNRTGIGEIRALMYGEMVEIDECEMPLYVFLLKTGLSAVVGEATMERLRKEAENDAVGKVWILVAVDVATGATLGFNVARSPNANDTLELIRRVLSDKRKFAREAGCQNDPDEPITPSMFVMDTGVGLWNNVVPHAMLILGISFKYGRVRSPTDKKFCERFFGTLGSDIMKELHGYAGQDAKKETDYDGAAMAVMSIAQLERYLWWYFTDCLPFKITTRKGGWGKRRKDLVEHVKSHYGHLERLSKRRIRLGLGLRVTRTVSKMGIEAFVMPYADNPEFLKWSLNNLGKKVTVLVDPHCIEEVTVITADRDVFYVKASLLQFRDFSLAEWQHFLEEWRYNDPTSEEVSVEALYRFYLRIRTEMSRLLESHGKEHKVIKIEDAQRMADNLAGIKSINGTKTSVTSLQILFGDYGTQAAEISSAFASDAVGDGIFTPGDDLIEDAEVVAETPPLIVEKSEPAGKAKRVNSAYSGVAKGKGGLK